MTGSALRPITIPAALLALLCGALWGGTSVAIQYSQDAWPPLLTAGLRFALGGIVVGGWCLATRQALAIQSGQSIAIAVVGVFLALQIGSFHWGHNFTNASHAQVMIGAHPVWVALLAHFLLTHDRLTWRKVGGLLLASAGILTVVFTRQTATGQAAMGQTVAPTVFGDLVILASSFLLSLNSVASKRFLTGIEPGKLVFWSNMLAAGLLLLASAVFEDTSKFRYGHAPFLALLYQGLIVAGFCFAAWMELLRRHRASHLAVFAFAQPLFGIVFGVLLRGEPFYAGLVAGGVAVALGIILVTARS